MDLDDALFDVQIMGKDNVAYRTLDAKKYVPHDHVAMHKDYGEWRVTYAYSDSIDAYKLLGVIRIVPKS